MAKFLFVVSGVEKNIAVETRLLQLDTESKAGKYKIFSHERGSDYVKYSFGLIVKAKDANKASLVFASYLKAKTSINLDSLERTVKTLNVDDISIVDAAKVSIKEMWNV